MMVALLVRGSTGCGGAELPLRSQLVKPEFLGFVAFLGVGFLQFYFIIGTIHSQLNSMGQARVAL